MPHLRAFLEVIACWLVTLCLPSAASAQQIRIFEDRFAALEEARTTCQPIVLHFYDAKSKSHVGRGQWISPEQRLRTFYSTNPDIRDKALTEAVVLLLPMQDWREAAQDLGVHSNEGLASLSPYELTLVDASRKWGDLIFR